MKRYILALFTVILLSTTICAQGFKVKATGVQTFSFKDDQGRNQGTFHSTTPLEDVDGTANNITGTVTFDVANFAKTLKGKIIVEAASINTGINLRNEHMKSANWLDVKQYPDITFEIKSVSDVKQIADNKLTFKVTGVYTMHGVSKDVTADAEAIYLDENEQTQQRAPGDLLGVKASFKVQLSDYGIKNEIIGSKVAQIIDVTFNAVGTNKF